MSRTRIASVHARQLIDCKCRPLVEVDIVTEGGALGRGSAPTGSSVGAHEAFVLRDMDPCEYGGLGVRGAVRNVNEIIAPALVGMDAADQRAVDMAMLELDGTPDKRRLGANAIYSASIACYRAAAAAAGRELYAHICGGMPRTVPIPSFNMINGGRYGNLVQAFNEFLVMPYRAKDIEEAVEIAVRVFQELESVIRAHTGAEPGIGRSYGWIAPSEDPEELLAILQEAIDRCGYTDKCAFALDCASSELYDDATSTYSLKGKRVRAEELVDYVAGLTERWNFVFIEDLMDENDWDGHALAHRRIKRTLHIADDLTVTNRERLDRAWRMEAIDGFILKPNQVGTITEALQAHAFAREKGLLGIPSGRSGGVIGDVVMDLAVGLQVPFIKNGCPRSGERIDKLNYLMRVNDLHPGCKLADISEYIRF